MLDFFLVNILGRYGVIGAIGLIFFVASFKNSEKLFEWIEDQTFGTRDYILQKCELLFIEIEPEHITYGLLFLAFGLPALGFAACALAGMVVLGIFVALLLGVVGWKIPRPFMDKMIERRIGQYEIQMVDALNLLANGLRAGLSLPQAVGMVVDELPAPVSQEFNLILQQNKIGVPLEECFENLVERVPTQDNEMFVTSINILRETGGNLAETFDTITGVIRERVRLKQKIDTATAQSMMQGRILASMPTALLVVFYNQDPENTGKLFTEPIGIVFLLISYGLNIAGFFVIKKMVKMDV
jgi:tight adherence protein B